MPARTVVEGMSIASKLWQDAFRREALRESELLHVLRLERLRHAARECSRRVEDFSGEQVNIMVNRP